MFGDPDKWLIVSNSVLGGRVWWCYPPVTPRSTVSESLSELRLVRCYATFAAAVQHVAAALDGAQ